MCYNTLVFSHYQSGGKYGRNNQFKRIAANFTEKAAADSFNYVRCRFDKCHYQLFLFNSYLPVFDTASCQPGQK
jgi:hypothetical protein